MKKIDHVVLILTVVQTVVALLSFIIALTA
jgi:hypothetical protein